MRAVFSKVMWVGRATTFCVGLSVILALVFGIGATALAAVPGDPFRLGRINSINTLTTLAGSVAGPLLKVDNNGSGPALALEANAGNPPLRVNAEAGTATNLDADELDGKDSSGFYARGEKVADASRADQADSATNAGDANTLDGKDSADFYAQGEKVADASHADSAAAADNSNTLDGKDSTDFYARGDKAADALHADQADSATSAGDANTLDGKDSSDFQPGNPCPSGTLFHEGVCIETARQGPAGYPNAEALCLQIGRRLPTVAELQTFRRRQDLYGAEFTSQVWFDANGSGQTQKVMAVDQAGRQSVASGSAAFRCVAPPSVAPSSTSTWESAAQSNLRNAAAAATACSANDGSYANCGTIAQIEAYGYQRDSNVTLVITMASATRWVAKAQHNNGGSAYMFDTETGQIVAIPRF